MNADPLVALISQSLGGKIFIVAEKRNVRFTLRSER